MSTDASRPWRSGRAGVHLFRRYILATKVKTGTTVVVMSDIYLLLLSWRGKQDKQTSKKKKTMSKKNGRAKKKNTCTSCTYLHNCWVMWPESCGHHCSLQFACNHIACSKPTWHTLYPVPYVYSVKWLWVIEKHYINKTYHYNYTYIHLTRHAHIPVRTTLSKRQRSNSASLCILARVHKPPIIFYLLKYINSLFVATRLASPGAPEKQH